MPNTPTYNYTNIGGSEFPGAGLNPQSAIPNPQSPMSIPECPRILVVDFDGTITLRNEWPNIGEVNHRMVAFLLRAYNHGYKIILDTCRSGKSLQQVLDFCDRHGIRFAAVNENLPDLILLFGSDTRKISGYFRIDDQAGNHNRPDIWPADLRAIWEEACGPIGVAPGSRIETDELSVALVALANEILRARAKHPTNRYLDVAILEELYEAMAPNVRSHIHTPPVQSSPAEWSLSPGNPEWLQVACVAMRIYMEGSTPLDAPDNFGSSNAQNCLYHAGYSARAALHAANVPD